MKTTLAVLLTGTLIVAGCGSLRESRLNPGNWFGNSTETPVASTKPKEEINPLLPVQKRDEGIFAKRPEEDRSTLINTISALRVEPTSTGAIVSVEGLSNRQGAYDIELRPVKDAPADVLEFELRADHPTTDAQASTSQNPPIRAALSLSTQDLNGIKLIRVVGAENVRETRRR
ncbi:hypothetical protein [Epibacterium ulvae]|uniref:hypothetical protein n=1 Tax=Epibacterium ulvae TaxID=1156985 RepID=UPI0024929091|nr:hypothetical protein [Epibacterium ulvae]